MGRYSLYRLIFMLKNQQAVLINMQFLSLNRWILMIQFNIMFIKQVKKSDVTALCLVEQNKRIERKKENGISDI